MDHCDSSITGGYARAAPRKASLVSRRARGHCGSRDGSHAYLPEPVLRDRVFQLGSASSWPARLPTRGRSTDTLPA